MARWASSPPHISIRCTHRGRCTAGIATHCGAASEPGEQGLGSVHMMQGRDAEAAAAYRAYLRLAPNAPDAGRIQALLSGL